MLDVSAVVGSFGLVGCAVVGRRIHVKVGNVEATVNDVNRAVNNVPSGTPTLTVRVDTIERTLADHTQTLDAIALRLNVKETPKS
jgi:hypothetical protein